MTTRQYAPVADETIAAEIRRHHAAMVAELDQLTQRLLEVDPELFAPARQALTTWFHQVLVPHADEEERTTYRAAGSLLEGRLLIEAMTREHVLIKGLVALFEGAGTADTAAAYGRAVFEAFHSHQAKENEVILPLLVEAPGTSLAQAMEGTHGHQVDGHAHHHAHTH